MFLRRRLLGSKKTSCCVILQDKEPWRKVSTGIWNPVVSTAVESIDKPSRNRWVVCYTKTNRFFLLYREKSESRLQFARGMVAWNIWIGLVDATQRLGDILGDDICMPISGGGHVLTGRDCPDETKHNHFQVCKQKVPDSFVHVS